jgi:hypothetical protein
MTNLLASTALLMLFAAPAAPWAGAPAAIEGQMVIHQHIIIRIPRMPMPRPTAQRDPMPPLEWHEERGPKCVPGDDLIAATIPTDDQVDLMLRDGERIRARLDKRCRSLDFYTGFYVVAGRDGEVCARRDIIKTRAGDNCPIDKFHRIVPGS